MTDEPMEKLNQDVRNARTYLRECEAKLRAAKLNAVGVHEGDIVRVKRKVGGTWMNPCYEKQEATVTKITVWGSGGVSLHGNFRNKDGKWSKRVQYLGSEYERVS